MLGQAVRSRDYRAAVTALPVKPFANIARTRAKKPQPAQQQANVVARATQHRVDRIAQRALELVPSELAVDLHVPDRRVDGAAPFYHRFQASREPFY